MNPFRRSITWTSLVAALAVVTVLVLRHTGPARDAGPLIDYGPLPDFTLTERSGAAVSRADLAGTVWIADFIFTRCVSTCPILTARMAQLQAALEEDWPVRLVSVTVDPEHDTLEVLSKYADHYRADPERWLFLRGAQGPTYELIRGGFHVGVDDVSDAFVAGGRGSTAAASGAVRVSEAQVEIGDRGDEAGGSDGASGDETSAPRPTEPFIHSTRLVLVDRSSRIRGYYDATSQHVLDRLLADIDRLLAEKKEEIQ